VEVDVRVESQPVIVLWLVCVGVVEDDVDFDTGVVADDVVHEREKFAPPSALEVADLLLPAQDVGRREQGRGSVSLIAV
jgi:hypothetical protein